MFNSFPTRWAICSCCEGNGKVDNPAFSNGFTSEEWTEMCSDDMNDGMGSTADRYLAGKYDVTCGKCKGAGKVQVPNISAMTFAQKRQLVAIRREQREEAEWRREAAFERMMGA